MLQGCRTPPYWEWLELSEAVATFKAATHYVTKMQRRSSNRFLQWECYTLQPVSIRNSNPSPEYLRKEGSFPLPWQQPRSLAPSSQQSHQNVCWSPHRMGVKYAWTTHTLFSFSILLNTRQRPSYTCSAWWGTSLACLMSHSLGWSWAGGSLSFTKIQSGLPEAGWPGCCQYYLTPKHCRLTNTQLEHCFVQWKKFGVWCFNLKLEIII